MKLSSVTEKSVQQFVVIIFLSD